MIIDCICGLKKFKVDDTEIPAEGRKVKCGACNQVWFYDPANPSASVPLEDEIQTQPVTQPVTETNNEPIPQSVEQTISQAEEEAPFVEESEPDTDLSSTESRKPAMKIFADEDADLPSKAEMDNALEDFKSSRKKKSFFASLFSKKDPLEKAKTSEKKAQIKKKIKKKDSGMTTRLLIYLLIILLFVLSVFMVPYKNHILMAFPQLDWYFDALTPYYNTIKGMILK